MTATEALDLIDRIRSCGVIPVVLPPKAGLVSGLGHVLVENGLPCIEVTFRAEGAPEAIERLRSDVPDLLVGAGTVLTAAQAARAFDAGAHFLVSPGTNPGVVDFAEARGIPIFPGVATPTEVETNLSRGLDVLKLFPAEVLGGIRFLKAMTGPYAAVRFIPTGGIAPANLAEYLTQSNVLACGGSWIAPPAALAAGDLDAIARRAREAAELVRAIRGREVPR